MGATCGKCGKSFRNAASIQKWHGWCTGSKAAEPKVDSLTALFIAAEAAGDAAAKGSTPTPMYVVERANPFDDNSRITREYEPVMDGVCGFASVIVSPGTSRFAKAAMKRYGNGAGRSLPGWLYAGKNYYGGIAIRIMGYNQSMTRKEAYAGAYLKVVSDALPELRLYVDSRMD